MCQAFSPSHVLHRHPGASGPVRCRQSWLDAKRSPTSWIPKGPCQIVPKDALRSMSAPGRYEDVDEAVFEYSHGALEHVTSYSLFRRIP
ncbi:MAG: hypothetical protein ACLU9S_05500 [Oscillospiraceae bacterium]